MTLQMGELVDSRPGVSQPLSGGWIVETASQDRDGRLVGSIDVAFGDADGTSYRVSGTIDLPELFE